MRVAQSAARQAMEVLEVQLQHGHKTLPPQPMMVSQVWRPPDKGVVKLNSDAAWKRVRWWVVLGLWPGMKVMLCLLYLGEQVYGAKIEQFELTASMCGL